MSQLRPQAGRRQASITREHSPIATIEDPIYVDPEERDIRLGDYLNDKLQILADFASLDSLIANVEKQRSQLHEQVSTLQAVLVSSRISDASPCCNVLTSSVVRSCEDQA